jgi:hypothetical protein
MGYLMMPLVLKVHSPDGWINDELEGELRGTTKNLSKSSWCPC